MKAQGAEYDDVEALYRQGRYQECQEQAAAEVARGIWNERWALLVLRCQLTTGQYAEALETLETAAKRYPRSVELRLLGYDVYRYNNQPEQAAVQLDEIVTLASAAPYRYTSKANLVTLGRCFLVLGEDARQILELFYDRVRRADPNYVDAYMASAELALEKHDYQVALEALNKAVKLDPQNPDIFYLMARAWESSDAEQAAVALATTLQLNEKHVPALLLRADNQIDAEFYDLAHETLQKVLDINPRHPQAWAYRAVLAHLQGDYEAEDKLREQALECWTTNPEVDYWIGRKLSQKYRFAEGVTYQRQSLEFAPNFLPAKFQLAQDLLRLGKADEGWQLTREVHQTDGYNVVAFNLVNLHDRLKQYATLERDGLIVRMTEHEARIYGDKVMALLSEAYTTLCEKYQVELDGPVTVEIFPQQKDFAVRTFGLPGGDGFLGVCFGRVITANSPASQGDTPSNWQSVLWHEFCHVVTLEKTRNRMPRWLSEGISVYEERLRDPAWGEQLDAPYREMLLGDDFTPISQLSGAFLRPKSPLHLQFAYFESSLAVQFLVETHGQNALLRILDDLAIGMPLEESMERHIGPMPVVDEQFTKYAQRCAHELAPSLEWDRKDLPEQADLATWRGWLEEHPNNYWALRRVAALQVEAEQWSDAKETLRTLHEAYERDVSPGNSLELLARVHRAQGDAAAERQALHRLAELDDDAVPVYMRLLELAAADEDWPAVQAYAQRMLAVQPLLPIGHKMLARAAEATGAMQSVPGPLNALLAMQPIDPAGLHYRLARAHEQLGDEVLARKHILLCLAEAPRYREAQELLLRLIDKQSEQNGG